MTLSISKLEHQSVICDPRRLLALQLTGLMDSPPELGFNRITTMISRLLDVPVALVSLVDERRQFFKSCHGVLAEPWHTLRETPLTHSFCQYVVSGNEALIIEDARCNDLVRGNLAIPDLGVIAYLGFPLVAPGGAVLGSLCAIDGKPKAWSSEAIETMKELAAIVSSEIHLRLEILARHASEEQLRAARQLADTENQGKSKFLANMSHELRTPLNAILGFSQVLLDELYGPLTPKQARYLKNVLSSGQHLLELINQILDLSKIEAGRWNLNLVSVDCLACLASVMAGLEPLLSAKGLAVRQDIPQRTCEIEADALALKQIFYNLLSNAIKFTQQGEITVKAECLPEKIVFSVRDSGRGIAPQDLRRVFDRFEQLQNGSDAGVGQGTGLGLSVTRGLVELHGGRIWVESAGLGCGSVFSFELPCRQPAPDQAVDLP